MIISVTERQNFKRCRQMWAWSSFNGESYSPIINRPALAIGKLWHATQAEWSLHPEQNPNELVLELANAEIDQVRANYYERVNAPISPLELEPVLDQMGLVIQMVRNYHNRWGTPLPDGFTMVAPEQTIVIPIPGTEHNCVQDLDKLKPPYKMGIVHLHPNCDGTHYLEATLDGLIADQYGRVYVLERKTYGQRPKVDVLNMSDQFLAYLWALRSLGIGEVGGIAYDGAWKRKEPPRNSTLEDLFIRIRLNRSRAELDNFGQLLAAEANDMANNPSIYLNRKWDGCWDCAFQKPCIEKLRGEDYQHTLSLQYTHRPKTEDNARELKDTED